MRILLASSGSGSRGGGEIFLAYLAEALAVRGHSVVLWVSDHPRMDELAQKCQGFSTVVRSNYKNTYDYPIRSVASCFNWHVSRQVAREWSRLRPDLIHINKQNLEDGLDLLRAATWSGLPSVCTVHLTQTAQYLQARMPRLRDLIARWQFRRFKGELVAVQPTRAIALDEFIGQPSRTRTILNGVPRRTIKRTENEREMTRRELGVSPKNFLIIGVGRLVPQKKPFDFLRIATELQRSVPSVRFLWVGDGDLMDQWNSAVAQNGLTDVVSCTGWCDDPTPYFLAGDLLLHVARFEGFPLALIEAMSLGLPCAVTRDLIEEIPMLAGSVLLADDIDGLGHDIQIPGTLALAANRGRKLYDHTLSAGRMAQEYEVLYADTIRRGEARRPCQ